LISDAKKITDLTDSAIIARFRLAQDQVYFTILYQRYARKVFGKCYSMLMDDGLARDATQDIFIKILMNLTKFNEQSSFSTWIYSITYNFCIDLIRKKKKVQVIYTEDVSKVKNDVDDDIPNSVILEMKQDRLSKVLDAIPPGDKAILLMKYIDDMPIKDIAEILDKTESAIKMQIMRAKIKAQSLHDEMFGKEAIENSDFFEMPLKMMKNE
jgi:RNA polymerase sigma factor (sigma-70 family)